MGPNERPWAQIREFREVLDICALADIGYVGLDWTYERKVQGDQYTRVRLDRALASNEWSAMFPLASLWHLTAIKSDHSPILLMNVQEANNRRIAIERPFWYEVMWERHQEFEAVMEQAWRSVAGGHMVAGLNAKLVVFTKAINNWNSTTFGVVRRELRDLRKKLKELRSLPDRAGPSY